jgi:hypothetical protein
MYFEVIGTIHQIEVIAAGPGIRIQERLRKVYGHARWTKMKGIATVRLANGDIRIAEVHWYQAHGIGKRDMKIKYFVED